MGPLSMAPPRRVLPASERRGACTAPGPRRGTPRGLYGASTTTGPRRGTPRGLYGASATSAPCRGTPWGLYGASPRTGSRRCRTPDLYGSSATTGPRRGERRGRQCWAGEPPLGIPLLAGHMLRLRQILLPSRQCPTLAGGMLRLCLGLPRRHSPSAAAAATVLVAKTLFKENPKRRLRVSS